jgi:putative sporulation protein YyaC
VHVRGKDWIAVYLERKIITGGVELERLAVNHKDATANYQISSFLKEHINRDAIIVCVGTDRDIGDSLGPLVGTMLMEKNCSFKVYGTLDQPIHALNLERKLEEIKKNHPKSLVIGVDACLGDEDCIGEINARDYPVYPGKGIGKCLPGIGDISVIGIIAESNAFMPTNNIRLSFIMGMAKVITSSILNAIHMRYSIEEVATTDIKKELQK